MTPLEERAKKHSATCSLVDLQQFQTFVENNIFLSQTDIKEQKWCGNVQMSVVIANWCQELQMKYVDIFIICSI